MKRLGLTVVLTVIILILIGAIGYASMSRNGNSWFSRNSIVKDSGSNISDYSAVFLTNGQVYFGKVYASSDNQPLDLRDIYYLQVNQQIQPDQKSTTTQQDQQPNIVLVKLGDELHGPNDRMMINRSQILFTESLKSDSKVVKAIGDYVNSKK